MDTYIASKDKVLSPATVAGYRVIRRNHLQGLMQMDVGEITRLDVQQAINIEAINHKPKTVKNVHGLLAAVLKEYNPDLSLNTKLPQKEKSSVRIPSDDELKKILSFAKDYNYAVYVGIVLAAYEGLRRSEICALTVSDIDFKRKVISVNKAIVPDSENNLVVKNTKSYFSNRVIPIFDNVMLVLLPYRDRSGAVAGVTPPQLTREFRRILQKLGIKGLRFHDLRHYFASVLLRLNVPDKYAMELMGHGTNAMLKNVYQHIMQDKQSEIRQDINNYFANM